MIGIRFPMKPLQGNKYSLSGVSNSGLGSKHPLISSLLSR